MAAVPRRATRSRLQLLASRSRSTTRRRALCSAAFAECDGLEMTMDVKTIREGGNNAEQIRLAGPVAYGTADPQARHDRQLRPVGLVRARWSTHAERCGPTARWCCSPPTAPPSGRASSSTRCLPVKLKAPALNAKDGVVAIEELQLAYESLTAQAAAGEAPVAEPRKLAKAELIELDADFNREQAGGKRVTVQFNPETLKVTFANQIASSRGGRRPARHAGRASSSARARPSSRCSCGSTSPRCPDGGAGRRRRGAHPAGRLLHHPAAAGRERQEQLHRRRACASPGASFQFDGIDGLARGDASSSSRPTGRPLRASSRSALSPAEDQRFAFTQGGAAAGSRGPAAGRAPGR